VNEAEPVQLLEDKGVMVCFGDEPPCPFGCSYCFANTPEISDNVELGKVPEEEADRRLQSILSLRGDQISCLFGSRLHDLFGKKPMEGIPHVERLARYGLHVSLLTKAHLTPDVIDQLEQIDQRLEKDHGKRVTVEVSLVSGHDRFDLEPRAPSVDERIETLEELSRRMMCGAVCISPMLPSDMVSTEELHNLVDRTSEFSPAYTVGKGFFYPKRMLWEMGFQTSFDLHQNSFDSNYLPYDIGGEVNRWGMYKSPRAKPLADYIRRKGRKAFHYSSDTVNSLAEEQAFYACF